MQLSIPIRWLNSPTIFGFGEELIRVSSQPPNMHFQFQKKGILTPFTIILPNYYSKKEIHLTNIEFNMLGRSFIIKPSNSPGGGVGVVKGAQTLADIQQVRQMFPNEKYLLQHKIIPMERDGRRFWFRGFYTCGLVQVVWWNDLTHIYDILTSEEIDNYHLWPVFEVVRKIARECKLNFFSTEIALDEKGRFIAIDYVNEVCDMRLKSVFENGVPNEVVENIARRIVEYVMEKTKICQII